MTYVVLSDKRTLCVFYSVGSGWINETTSGAARKAALCGLLGTINSISREAQDSC